MNILQIAQKHGTYREVSPGEYSGPCPKCGGAMRLKIWPDKNEFKCTHCTVKGGIAEIGTIFPVGFSVDRADNLLKDLNGTIGAEYLAGAVEWLSAKRPDVIKSLKDIENQIDAAYLADNMPELAAKTDLAKRSYLKAFELFRQRPPVVEVAQ